MPRHRPGIIPPAGNSPEPAASFLPPPLLLTGAARRFSEYVGFPLASGLAAGPEFRLAPSPRRRRAHWEWAAALALHAAAIALALISFQPKLSMAPPEQSGVSVVFQNSGNQQSATPPAPVKGPPTQAQTPPAPAAAPPPPPVTAQLPEMDLNIPQDLFSQQELPPPAPQPQPRPVQKAPPRHVRTYHPHPQYQVMNGMSFGNTSGAPAPAIPGAKPGVNLQLSQSDLNALNKPEITVQGEIGSDWMAGFNKWVNDHTYYPQAALEQGQEGTSTIQFTVHRDGHVTDLHLLNSAGSPFLDQAWLGIFAQNNVPPFPPGTKSDTIKITASLQYEILR